MSDAYYSFAAQWQEAPDAHRMKLASLLFDKVYFDALVPNNAAMVEFYGGEVVSDIVLADLMRIWRPATERAPMFSIYGPEDIPGGKGVSWDLIPQDLHDAAKSAREKWIQGSMGTQRCVSPLQVGRRAPPRGRTIG